MTEITIYKFQLESIIDALRITSNIHNSSKGKTCHDRQVRQSLQYAKNALSGEKDIEVSYMKSTTEDNAERKYTEVEMIEFANYCGLYDFHIHHQIWVSKINFRTRKTTKELFNEFLTSLNK